ncbi:uncharacterized protein [Rutidosis leptorrhynchoides]|uniref:uncharacterized protein n=1 Tax=Rutidosis leptorrhynchoides TaxID=125765 RepID=UPI003A998C52
MADDVRRWSVTYTKHIHQKRKVYQDGFLELQSSSHKVKLYDDCDKLLDSRIVKLDDAVRSGETLTFGAFLVDIGDPQGESKPLPNPILQRDKTMADRDGKPNNSKLKGTSKGSFHSGKRSSINLSPSHKIIREFKRREVNKYCSSPNVQDTVKDDPTEWEVLYTAQLTQKAKKFHDGILKVALSGLRGRQVFLYDGTRTPLESRFLKTVEKINVGDTLRFDGHIVDILELKDNKPLKATSVERSNCYTQSTVQLKIRDEHLADSNKCVTNKSSISTSCQYTTKTNLIEWDVMYTTQVTQKAKKFHDGVLKLASSGSQGRQEATLLADDGMILTHRYLKLSEDISSGSSFNMTNYLVEIGEPKKRSEGGCPKKDSTSKSETRETINVDDIKLCKRMPATEPLSEGKVMKRALPLQDTDSKAKNSIADNVIATTISKNKPLRDAFYEQHVFNPNVELCLSSITSSATYMLSWKLERSSSILSFLRKPSAQDGVMEKVNVKEETPAEEPVCNEETRAANVGGQSDTMSSKATNTLSVNELAKETNQSNTEISDNKQGFKKTDSRNDEFPSFDLGID